MKLPEDAFVLELLPEFIDQWLIDIDEQYDELINTKNDADLYRLAHTLKGSCLQFSLDDIAALGIQLQGISKALSWDEAIEMKSKLVNKFKEAREFITSLGM
ncbi:MAG: Hpt domain-containing protein [Candidatus Kapabacteria bacterium]|nr:Hpt domain-containing protein [Candidatus Kapabacteria bacterium]